MSNTIDILVVIDAETLASTKPGGSLNAPISLGAWGTSDPYIYMITEGAFVISDQAQSELNVKVNSGDNIRWTITCPGAGINYSVIMYGFTTNNPSAMTTPVMLDITVNEYNPTSVTDPTGPRTAVSYQNDVWQATIVTPNTSITYHWSFMVIDPNNNVVGYYNWDPFITVGN